MRKIRFTECQAIAVLKSVKAGRTLQKCHARPLVPKLATTAERRSMMEWKSSLSKNPGC